jgi:hypothetical protein
LNEELFALIVDRNRSRPDKVLVILSAAKDLVDRRWVRDPSLRSG